MAVAEGRVCLNDANRFPIFTELVLEREERTVTQEKSGLSFLQLCCRCPSSSPFRRIFVAGAEAFFGNVCLYLLRYLTLLFSMGSLAAVRMLLEKKRASDSSGGAGGRGSGGDRSAIGPACDVNAFSSSKCTALHIATRHRYMEIVKLLLQVHFQLFYAVLLLPPASPPPFLMSLIRTGRTPTCSQATAAAHLHFVCSLRFHRHSLHRQRRRNRPAAMRLPGQSQVTVVLSTVSSSVATRCCISCSFFHCVSCIVGFSTRFSWGSFD